MPMKPELTSTYDADMRSISAKCSRCGLRMPTPPPNLNSVVDTIAWLLPFFLEHVNLKHPAPTETQSSHEQDPYS